MRKLSAFRLARHASIVLGAALALAGSAAAVPASASTGSCDLVSSPSGSDSAVGSAAAPLPALRSLSTRSLLARSAVCAVVATPRT